MEPELRPNQCCESVMGDGPWGSLHRHQCKRTTNLVERDGNLYCKQHDPVEVKKREEARSARWDAKWKAREEELKAEKLIHVTHSKLVELAQVGHELLSVVDDADFDERAIHRYNHLIEDLKKDGLDIVPEPSEAT